MNFDSNIYCPESQVNFKILFKNILHEWEYSHKAIKMRWRKSKCISRVLFHSTPNILMEVVLNNILSSTWCTDSSSLPVGVNCSEWFNPATQEEPKATRTTRRKYSQHPHKHNSGCVASNYRRVTKLIEDACFLPAKPVGHDSYTEGSHHTANTKDGHGNTPDNCANSWADWLSITLHPGVVEERS